MYGTGGYNIAKKERNAVKIKMTEWLKESREI